MNDLNHRGEISTDALTRLSQDDLETESTKSIVLTREGLLKRLRTLNDNNKVNEGYGLKILVIDNPDTQK